jgi:hypothetical protein
MTRRLQETVDRAFGDLSPRERDYLCRSAQSNFSQADTAAVVLGLDLRRDEIAAWRERSLRSSDVPCPRGIRRARCFAQPAYRPR